MPPAIITLTTDFTSSGGYVGSLKGILLGINPNITIVDISHDVPAQNIAGGAFTWWNACRYFPSDAIHLAIVDPGVGTSRRAVIFETPTGKFIAPDNGLMTYLLYELNGINHSQTMTELFKPVVAKIPKGCRAYTLNRSQYWRKFISNTFHGRDIFAPVAAHLSNGIQPDTIGDRIHELTVLNMFDPIKDPNKYTGHVIFVDNFGNLITNIPESFFVGDNKHIKVGRKQINHVSRTYEDGDNLVALVGSHGFLEIAQKNGNAAHYLQIGLGEKIEVVSNNV